MLTNSFDVVVIGAGAAGMMAAWELALTGKSVAIIEAANRTGGRIFSLATKGFDSPVELGAEFVHGNLPLTLQVFKKAGIDTLPSNGDVWQMKDGFLQKQDDFFIGYDEAVKACKNLEDDMSVADFLEQNFGAETYAELRAGLKRYVQGYYAGDVKDASVKALCEELTGGESVNYRVEGSYAKLVAYLEAQCLAANVGFFLSNTVEAVKWKAADVEVVTQAQSFKAKKVLLTVSIGVLQQEKISFAPAISHKIKAIKQLGYGNVIKLNLQFDKAFWKEEDFTKGKNLSKMNFLFSTQEIPTWWTQHPQHKALLVGWLSGPPAAAFRHLSEEELLQKAIASLAHIFSTEAATIKEMLVATAFHNWIDDSHFCGAYSYNVVGGEALIQNILQPESNTIYFAGEGLHIGNQMGTVEAALVSGRTVAHQIVADMRD